MAIIKNNIKRVDYKFTTEDWANRLKKVLTAKDVLALLNIIKLCLNLKATTDDEFGVVNYPKK